MPSVGARYWQRRLARWPSPRPTEGGYSLLLPVPGDIPVFLEMALTVCGAQQASHRVETLVLPDKPTEAMRHIVGDAQSRWDGALRLEPLPMPERWVLPRIRSGSRNHGLQLYAGVGASQATHVVLHDADLFLLGPAFLDEQYSLCCRSDLACVGVSPVWDGWFATHGLDLAATWEMTASVRWLREFAPWRHIGHSDTLFGEEHVFDTTLWPQCQTAADRIAVSPRADFVHFNYVISAYRHFQRQGPGFEDSSFRLLLIALLTALFSRRPERTEVPSLAALSQSVGSTSGIVRYPLSDVGSQSRYGDFRGRLQQALAAPYLLGDPAAAAGHLARFDDFYAFEPSSAPLRADGGPP